MRKLIIQASTTPSFGADRTVGVGYHDIRVDLNDQNR